MDDLTVLHQLNSVTEKDQITLFKPKDSYRTQGRSSKPSLTQGTNLPNGVVVYFNLKNYNEKEDVVQLHFKENDGTLIKTFSTSSKEDKLIVNKGGNQFVWDSRYEGAETQDGMIFWSASFSGAKAVPGNYSVELDMNGKIQKQDFTILKDPRAEVSLAEMKEQFDFVNTVNKTVDDAHIAIGNIRMINEKLSDFEDNYGELEETKNLLAEVKLLKGELSNIEKALYQTQNMSRQDPLNFPIRLTNKLGHLNRLVTTNDFPPTQQDEAVRLELTQKIELQLEHYNKLISDDLEDFNIAFAKLKLDYLNLK